MESQEASHPESTCAVTVLNRVIIQSSYVPTSHNMPRKLGILLCFMYNKNNVAEEKPTDNKTTNLSAVS